MSASSDVREPGLEGAEPRGHQIAHGLNPDAAVRRLASILGVTEGQVYTLSIGLVVAMIMAVIGIPSTLHNRSTSTSASAPAPAADGETFSGGGSPTVTSDTVTSDTMTSTTRPGQPSTSPSTRAPTVVAPPANSEESGPGTTSSPTRTAEPSFADGGTYGAVEHLTAVGPPGAPDGIAVGPRGEFYVATDNGGGRGGPGPSKVLRYSPAGVLEDDYEIGGQSEDREHGLKGLVLDGDGLLYALDGSTGRIIRLDPDEDFQDVFATLPDLSPCTPVDDGSCEPGPRNHAPLPRAAAFGESGDLFITDAGQGVVWRVSPSGETEVWVADSRFASPTGAGPAGLQFDAAGKLVLTVTTSLVGLTGGVYVVGVDDDGNATDVQLLYQALPHEEPSGLALGASGRMYVALAGTDELLVLKSNGEEADRIAGPEAVPLDAPAALAFRGLSLLVTNQSTHNGDPDSGAVLRVFVDDEGTALHRPMPSEANEEA